MTILNPIKYKEALLNNTLKIEKRNLMYQFSFVVKVGVETVAYSPSWIRLEVRDEFLEEYKKELALLQIHQER